MFSKRTEWKLTPNRFTQAQADQRAAGMEVLDLSLVTSQYGRQINPCKACVSTAQPLCHWPCSCYPNHAIGPLSENIPRQA